ncbi:hypothetical protein A1O1_01665 [Capronia coronata CBS 617.96]|uniref:Copper-fist domain-containing protein n=1 Tax=Capronia coronata CBS 617.96 TaxID=1182541 RepID=W9YL20_9EURO|nr:uncharacterized protein A1O1_01665 [Capronia coronata CBS 617.96]EXJ93273.1 hypothetical protein A1O1_01665 [Capronia coronata CBS 617.96]
MYVIVRVDGPQTINREATTTPRPVWEDENGYTMTLKKVWADANGKEIDDEEYQARRRRMKEREEGMTSTPEVDKSSCCSSKKTKEESQSPSHASSSGCRHRQNITISQSEADKRPTDSAQDATRPGKDAWVATCSCGSGCSCLYCPDHPNNETSIKHTQQQVKILAEQAYAGEGLMPTSVTTDNNPRSCMGGRPSFFLSKTPGVSQQQLEQFFPEDSDPGAIYLTYPIQQHSWTNQPLSAHCSHVQSPATAVATSPDPTERYLEPVNEVPSLSTPWDLFPVDSAGTWDFSDGPLGNTSFSWIDLDSSRGTDYSIGQATVASIGNRNMPMMLSAPQSQQAPAVSLDTASMTGHTDLGPLATMTPNDFSDSCCQFGVQDGFVNFDVETANGPSIAPIQAPDASMSLTFSQQSAFMEQTLNNFDNLAMQSFMAPQPQATHHDRPGQETVAVHMSSIDENLESWNGYDPLLDNQEKPVFTGISITSPSPIANGS